MHDPVRTATKSAARLASVSWAARTAGVSRSVAYCWARTGRLPGCVELGGRYYVRVAPFLRWLDGIEAPTHEMPDAEDLGVAREARSGKAS